MATQETVLFVQVKNVITLGKFHDEWYLSNDFLTVRVSEQQQFFQNYYPYTYKTI